MPAEKIPHITCEHLARLENGDEPAHVVVDLRDPVEFDAGHIKGSVNVPRRELTTNLASLVPDKGKHVIVVVGPTHEPEIESVHEDLAGLGYGKVEFLAGGFDRWCEIADIEIDGSGEMTPEEMGYVGEGDIADDDADPHSSENEPLF